MLSCRIDFRTSELRSEVTCRESDLRASTVACDRRVVLDLPISPSDGRNAAERQERASPTEERSTLEAAEERWTNDTPRWERTPAPLSSPPLCANATAAEEDGCEAPFGGGDGGGVGSAGGSTRKTPMRLVCKAVAAAARSVASSFAGFSPRAADGGGGPLAR